ncbi:MAG TPA: PIN domain-containing protein [Burkholderiaceae bacterium]|jgi:predicted nucleic acid-binding protein
MSQRAIVLDANILIRAVLGERVHRLILEHADEIKFYAPDAAYVEAGKYLPTLLAKRRMHATSSMAALDALCVIVPPVDGELLLPFRQATMTRIAARDPDDWPALACTLMLDCPIWTEDTDFFGTGVATWTTNLVEIYLKAPRQEVADSGAAVDD